jgi:hypothetical protein
MTRLVLALIVVFVIVIIGIGGYLYYYAPSDTTNPPDEGGDGTGYGEDTDNTTQSPPQQAASSQPVTSPQSPAPSSVPYPPSSAPPPDSNPNVALARQQAIVDNKNFQDSLKKAAEDAKAGKYNLAPPLPPPPAKTTFYYVPYLTGTVQTKQAAAGFTIDEMEKNCLADDKCVAFDTDGWFIATGGVDSSMHIVPTYKKKWTDEKRGVYIKTAPVKEKTFKFVQGTTLDQDPARLGLLDQSLLEPAGVGNAAYMGHYCSSSPDCIGFDTSGLYYKGKVGEYKLKPSFTTDPTKGVYVAQ